MRIVKVKAIRQIKSSGHIRLLQSLELLSEKIENGYNTGYGSYVFERFRIILLTVCVTIF